MYTRGMVTVRARLSIGCTIGQILVHHLGVARMTTELVNLISKRFIARPDVKARQFTGGYTPVRESKEGPYIPWSRKDLEDHLAGSQTYGHYLISKQDEVKLFAFDIDLEKTGFLPADPMSESYAEESALRDAWHIKAAPPGHPLHDPLLWARREYMKINFMLLAKTLAMTTADLLQLDVAVAYSGNKGVHVYAFLPGPLNAAQAREGALMVLEACEISPSRGEVFFKHDDRTPDNGFPNLSIEVYPKQDSVGENNLGNLLRLPLGRNLKNAADPTFFIDMTEDLTVMKPTDPVRALTPGNNFLAKA